MVGKDAEHHDLVLRLEERVRGSYSITMTEVPVRDPDTGRTVGEIDLIGIIGGVWDLYEVKLTDNEVKARHQLTNLRNYLQDCANVRLYYYRGKDGKIVRIG